MFFGMGLPIGLFDLETHCICMATSIFCHCLKCEFFPWVFQVFSTRKKICHRPKPLHLQALVQDAMLRQEGLEVVQLQVLPGRKNGEKYRVKSLIQWDFHWLWDYMVI
jgi:hypothetical protein